MEYWFLFPLGIVIATVGMSAGVAGSNFWIPVYLLWLGLEPRLAFWVSLLTMLFGFGSGVVRNLRDGNVDSYLVGRYLLAAAPAALVGALASTRVPVSGLLAVFAVLILTYGIVLIVRRGIPASAEPHQQIYWPIGVLAGLLQGVIATGSGILLMPALLGHQRIRHHAEAVGSTVVVVFVLSLLSIAFRIDQALLQVLEQEAGTIFEIMVFAATGVLVGGQIGPRVARALPRHWLRVYVGVLLLVIGALVGVRALWISPPP